MKKTLFLAVIAAMALNACSNDRIIGGNDPDPDMSDTPVGFRTITDKSGTRAPVTDATNIQSFRISGWWDKTASAFPDGENLYGDANRDNGLYLFHAEAMDRGEKGATNEWSYSPQRYWPSIGDIDFFAYSPASSRNIDDKRLADITKAVPEINYIVPTVGPNDIDNQEDFLVAASLDQRSTTGSPAGTVALKFQHALSRVKFNAAKIVEDINYEIVGIRLVGLYSKAELDLTETDSDNRNGNSIEASIFQDYTYYDPDDPVRSGLSLLVLWKKHSLRIADVAPNFSAAPAETSTAASRASGYAVDFGQTPVNVLYSDPSSPVYSTVLGGSNALMVMPQRTILGEVYTDSDYNDGYGSIKECEINTPKNSADPEAFYIVVSYKAYYPGVNIPIVGGGPAGSDNEWQDMYIPVSSHHHAPGTEPLTFEIGRQYTFNLTFGGSISEIKFEVDVESWDPVIQAP